MVRVRIAPSPTGRNLHIGNVYAALINYAFAKKHKGRFVVRIEDTDRKRLIAGSEERILDSLCWLGLFYDEGPDAGGPYGPYRQSERLELYKNYAQELVNAGRAYYCFCSPERLTRMRKDQQKKGLPPKYDGKCRKQKTKNKKQRTENYVIRLKVPQRGETVFNDIIRGKISFKNETIDDQVLLKSDGYPTYHLAVVVDDCLMKISHIIRAEEWISSTPKHILLYRFFDWPIPKYAHLPILRNPDKSKLSKRKNPVWISWYKEQGFLPEAILNYLALMGWSMPDGREIFTLDEFIKEFSLRRVSSTGPVFDIEKLEWLNGEHLRKAQGAQKLKAQIYKFLEGKYPQELIGKTVPLVKERMRKLSEYLPLCEFFFKKPKEYEEKINQEWLKEAMTVFKKELDWKTKNLYQAIAKLGEEKGVSRGKFFMNIRIAVTGKKIGPPLFESLEILGKRETFKRLQSALSSEK